jgi:hypothetical protein
MRYTTRPLSDRTWLRPNRERKTSQFDTTWTKTLNLLDREIEHLGGHDVVIEVDVREQDIKLDGMLRANARATSPAVVVAFETEKHGPMLYRADRYADTWSNRPGWQENVRAVALTLESLRAVDRYGATETGQQYAGFKALPAGRAVPASHMTRDAAIAVLAGIHGIPVEHLNTDPDVLRSTWRAARRLTHPDRNNGDATRWDQVEQAAQVLGVAR